MMQQWTVILDYGDGASERVDSIDANTAVLAAGVARLCRASSKDPTMARVFPQSGQPIGIHSVGLANC